MIPKFMNGGVSGGEDAENERQYPVSGGELDRITLVMFHHGFKGT